MPTSNRRGTGHDLGEFLRDRRLTRLVVDQLEFGNHVAGVVGRRLHGHHAGRLLGRHVFGHSLVHQRFDVTQQQVVDDRLCIGLVDVVPGVRTG